MHTHPYTPTLPHRQGQGQHTPPCLLHQGCCQVHGSSVIIVVVIVIIIIINIIIVNLVIIILIIIILIIIIFIIIIVVVSVNEFWHIFLVRADV